MEFPTKELAARARALELGAEDEFGLYELVWSLNATYPDASSMEHVLTGRAALLKLLDEGRIELLSAHWASAARREPLELQDARSLIASDASWEPPSRDRDAYACFVVPTHRPADQR